MARRPRSSSLTLVSGDRSQRREAPAPETSASSDSAEARFHSVALTKLSHIRHEAAALYNRLVKQWGPNYSPSELRALVDLLSLVRQTIYDTTLDARMTAIEKKVGIYDGQLDEELDEESEESDTPVS